MGRPGERARLRARAAGDGRFILRVTSRPRGLAHVASPCGPIAQEVCVIGVRLCAVSQRTPQAVCSLLHIGPHRVAQTGRESPRPRRAQTASAAGRG
jgi:hypothetical protein